MELNGHLGVKHCFDAGHKGGMKSRQTLNVRYDLKIIGVKTIGDKLFCREGNNLDHQLKPLNDRSALKEVGVQR
jgi:hypothetical protein